MCAFHEPIIIREVNVPDDHIKETNDEELLDIIYQYGQNDIQNVHGVCSVSVGDVIEIPFAGLYRVSSIGFKQMTPDEFEKYKLIPRRDRTYYGLFYGKL